jgi:hypothetical protein
MRVFVQHKINLSCYYSCYIWIWLAFLSVGWKSCRWIYHIVMFSLLAINKNIEGLKSGISIDKRDTKAWCFVQNITWCNFNLVFWSIYNIVLFHTLSSPMLNLKIVSKVSEFEWLHQKHSLGWWGFFFSFSPPWSVLNKANEKFFVLILLNQENSTVLQRKKKRNTDNRHLQVLVQNKICW